MASSALELLFKIKADSSDARSDIRRLRNAFDTDVKAIETTGKNSFLKLGESIGLSSGQMATLTKLAPLAGAAIVGVGVAAVGAAVALFSLAKSTAEFGSEIFDASQKTGLGTVALSALKFAAEQSDGSMAELTAGIKIFSKTVGDAINGSKEAAEKLKRLGIDPQEAIKDLEGALAKAFKTINEAPEGIRQTNAALDAFGRSGANLIPTIKSFDGDLAGLITRAKELGVTLSEEDAKAADEFGDTLDTLTAQFKGVGYQVAREFMPQLVSSMKEISTFIKENQATFKEWGVAIGDTIEAVKAVWKSEIGEMIQDLLKLSNLMTTQGLLRWWEGPTPTTPDTSTSSDPQNRMKASQQASATNAVMGRPEVDRGSTVKRERAANAELKVIHEERQGIIDDAGQKELAALQKLNRQKEDIAHIRDKSDLERTSDNEQRKVITLVQAEIQRAAIIASAFNRRRATLEAELVAAKSNAEVHADIQHKLNILSEEGAAFREEHERRKRDAIEETRKQLAELEAEEEEYQRSHLERLEELAAKHRQIAEEERVRREEEEAERIRREEDASVPDFFGGLFGTQSVEEMTKSVSVMTTLGGMMQNVFSGVAQAVGAAVKSFVLFGTAGTSFRKFAAEVIASVAQMAAVQAVFELAQGFAMSALAWFTGNPKFAKAAADHFFAAAVFGAIAGVAAVVGRGIAGNSFQQQGAGGGGGGTSGGGGSSRSAGAEPETRSIEQDRNQGNRVDHFIHVVSNDSHILKVLQNDERENGWMRQTFALKGEV